MEKKMEIESIQVIPMSKESKWEDITPVFEVSMITTDYVIWFTKMYDDLLSYGDNNYKPELDKSCLEFAKKQQAYMLAPTAIFGSQIYAAKSKTADTLDGVVIDGPLYRVECYVADDMSAEKTVEKTYIDPVTFLPTHGLWYPQKKMYKVRYGQLMNG
jgi:hypothetical protein